MSIFKKKVIEVATLQVKAHINHQKLAKGEPFFINLRQDLISLNQAALLQNLPSHTVTRVMKQCVSTPCAPFE